MADPLSQLNHPELTIGLSISAQLPDHRRKKATGKYPAAFIHIDTQEDP